MKILGLLLFVCTLLGGTAGYDTCHNYILCPSGKSLKVTHRYEGPYLLTDSGTLGQFGPSPGPLKYYHFLYYCALSKVACEGQSLSISCSTGKIKVIDAVYGRLDTSTCSSHSNRNCRGQLDEYLAKQACNQKTSCTVSASNSVFGDPCARVPKYLKIWYICN